MWLQYYKSMNEADNIYMRVPRFAKTVYEALAAAGFDAWFVGGFVRDAIMGRTCHDIDIATNAHWQDVRNTCAAAGMRVRETGTKHGTVTVLVDDNAVEVTTFRTEGAYSDGRRPDSVAFVGNIEEDLTRRDFTMNAIAYKPKFGMFDPLGGVADIEAGIIRVVGNPKERFKEDALRILRACRFASQLGFRIAPETLAAMTAHKRLLENVSRERITQELDGLLLGTFVHDALMETVDVLAFVLPELVAMKGCEQRTKYHCFDVLEHTAWTVQFVPAERLMRWAALCHDMGKPACAFFDDAGVEHFYGHAEVGAQIARGLLARFCMSSAFVDDVCLVVARHNDVIAATPRSVRRALAKADGNVALLRAGINLKRADMLAHAPKYAARAEADMDAVAAALDTVLADECAFSVGMLAVNGHDVIAAGVNAGPEVGKVLSWLLSEVIEERLPNEREALLDALRAL